MHTLENFARAVLEGVTFSLKDLHQSAGVSHLLKALNFARYDDVFAPQLENVVKYDKLCAIQSIKRYIRKQRLFVKCIREENQLFMKTSYLNG